MRVSYRADRADLVVDAALEGIDHGRFVDIGPGGPGWGSLTHLLRCRGWAGLHVVQTNTQAEAWARHDASIAVEQAQVGTIEQGQAGSSGHLSHLPGLCQRHFGDEPVHLVCMGGAAPHLPGLLGLLGTQCRPWILCLEQPPCGTGRVGIHALLGRLGYRRLFGGPTVDLWVSADAPASLHTFSYAGAVVMRGPAMPMALMPRPLEPTELLALDDDCFVPAAYWSVLRRPADAAGLAHYEQALRQGRSRAAILADLANSEEAQARQVGESYRQPGAQVSAAPGHASPWHRLVERTRRWLGAAAAPDPLARLGGEASGGASQGARPEQTGGDEQQMDWPHYKISYAQNFEDLVLAGLLKSVSAGFYVDVGANHPELDSVTRIFYDKGWRGINVEPNDELHRLLEAQRPRDINVKAAASSQPGSLTLRIYEGLDGLSTISRETQASHAASLVDKSFRDVQVPVVCLADLLARHRPVGDIHFLKVDVEGLEMEVLLGNDWRRFRPWVLCLERNLQVPRQEAICTFLREYGYQAVFWDGINDFFVADERRDIWTSFSYANDVVLNGVPVNYIFVRTMAALARQVAARDGDPAP